MNINRAQELHDYSKSSDYYNDRGLCNQCDDVLPLELLTRIGKWDYCEYCADRLEVESEE
jgi:hypothetical protein